MREVAPPDPVRAGEELVHRAGDGPRQREPHHERGELDHQEETPDARQQDQEDVLEAHLPGRRRDAEQLLGERRRRHPEGENDRGRAIVILTILGNVLVARWNGPAAPVRRFEEHHPLDRGEARRVERVVRPGRLERADLDAGGRLEPRADVLVERQVDDDRAGIRAVHHVDHPNHERRVRPHGHEAREPVRSDPRRHGVRPRPVAPRSCNGPSPAANGVEHQPRDAPVLLAHRGPHLIERRRRRHAAGEPGANRPGGDLDVAGHGVELPAHAVGAGRQHRHRSGHGEERDDEQHRHEADEDVRQDELPADTPEQPALEADQQSEQDGGEAGGQRERRAGVQPVEDRLAAPGEREENELGDRAKQQEKHRP